LAAAVRTALHAPHWSRDGGRCVCAEAPRSAPNALTACCSSRCS